ncbi:MAG TPA: aldo/keto reductase, partial [Anaerolineales bacterium]|nr:aldo/keto reductase [Anaerolineales bacterium]
GVIPWSPMARGFFARNSKSGTETSRLKTDGFFKELYGREDDFLVADRAAEVAKERGVTSSQIALAWLLNKPHIAAPIIGSSKEAHLDEAIAALEIRLSEEEVKRLEELYQPHPVLGHS